MVSLISRNLATRNVPLIADQLSEATFRKENEMKIHFYKLECKCPIFSFNRYWNKKIWNIALRGYTISLDFRKNWLRDMIPEQKDKERFDRMMRKINGEEPYEYEKLEKLKQALQDKENR